MRFIIHGAGSIGSLIGGRLAESGAEVILIARHAHAAAINRGGLLIKSRAGERVVHDGRGEDAGDDRPGPAETRGEDEGEQLGLVADLGERDHAGREEEGFQCRAPRKMQRR